MSRVDASRIAVRKAADAELDLNGSVLASELAVRRALGAGDGAAHGPRHARLALGAQRELGDDQEQGQSDPAEAGGLAEEHRFPRFAGHAAEHAAGRGGADEDFRLG